MNSIFDSKKGIYVTVPSIRGFDKRLNSLTTRNYLKSKTPEGSNHTENMILLIELCLTKGYGILSPNRIRMIPKSEMDTLMPLLEMYNIKDKVNDRDDITLSKIVNAHPELAVQMLMANNIQRPFTSEMMELLGYSNYSKGLGGTFALNCFPQITGTFGGINYTLEYQEAIVKGVLAYMVHESKKINWKNPETHTIKYHVYYARNAYKSHFLFRDDRVELLKIFDLSLEKVKPWIGVFNAAFPEYTKIHEEVLR